MTLEPFFLIFLRSSLLAGITSFRVSFKSGSADEEYSLAAGVKTAETARGCWALS